MAFPKLGDGFVTILLVGRGTVNAFLKYL